MDDDVAREIERLRVGNEDDKGSLQQTLQRIIKRSDAINDRTKEHLEHKKRQIKQKEDKLELEREHFRREKREFEDTRDCAFRIALRQQAPLQIVLVVGGEEFETSRHTILASAQLSPDENSILAATVARIGVTDHNRVKIDRDPKFFAKILDYLRQRASDTEVERWLVCLKGCDDQELRMTRHEAEYYKIRSLSNHITWELVSRKDKPNSMAKLGFGSLVNSVNQIVGYATTHDISIDEMNFEVCVIRTIEFKHKVTFRGCVLKNADFTKCAFLENLVEFRDCDIRGVKFTGCKSNGLSPSLTIHLERCIGNLPARF